MTAFDLSVYMKFFIGLVAIVNPLGLLPVFVSLTSHMGPEERLKTNSTANIAVVVIILVAMCVGQLILDGFGISLASFRIAGGTLITLIAWSMLQGKLGEDKQNKEERGELGAKESIAVVPLAMPLMAGPGAISSVIVYASQATWAQIAGYAIVTIIFAFCSWLLLRAAPLVYKIMGNTGINVFTRIMGLIMMALGIEIVVSGVKAMFPILA